MPVARIIMRYLIMVSALGLLGFSCIQFYSQSPGPALREFSLVYQFLHGAAPWTHERSFPQNVPFKYAFSQQLQIGGERALYFRDPQIIFGQSSTEIEVTFYSADGKDLPPFSALASAPTLHLEDSVFGLRSVSTKDPVGPEMTFAFVFPSIGYREGSGIQMYLNGSDYFSLGNPSADPPIVESGTNIWGVLASASFAVLVITGLWRPKKVPLPESLRSEWRALDSERKWAAECIGLPGNLDTRMERHKSAQECLDRAEQILLRSYEEAIRGEALAGWLAAAFLLLCVVAAGFVVLPGSISLKSLLVGHYSSNPQPVGDLYNRLRSVELERTFTIRLALSIIPFCLTAIIGNWLLSIWKTKATARKMIQRCLDGFGESFETQLVSELSKAEGILEEKQKEISTIQERLDKAQASVIAASQQFILQIRNTVISELGSICIPVQDQKSQDK